MFILSRSWYIYLSRQGVNLFSKSVFIISNKHVRCSIGSCIFLYVFFQWLVWIFCWKYLSKLIFNLIYLGTNFRFFSLKVFLLFLFVLKCNIIIAWAWLNLLPRWKVILHVPRNHPKRRIVRIFIFFSGFMLIFGQVDIK